MYLATRTKSIYCIDEWNIQENLITKLIIAGEECSNEFSTSATTSHKASISYITFNQIN